MADIGQRTLLELDLRFKVLFTVRIVSDDLVMMPPIPGFRVILAGKNAIPA